MGAISYERPREKLFHEGINFLSTVELIQLIFASGSQGMSVASLAKEVERVLTRADYSLDTLMAIRGIGPVKAAQIIAALELGKRV